MNKLFSLLLCIAYFNKILSVSSKASSVVDKGDYVLICSQEPIDFGIVLDSSVSIAEPDFDKAKEFLVKFLSQFDIGAGYYDVRVSLITFGLGIYPQDAFNLDTYKTKDEVLDAIMEVPHRAGPRTDTGLAIKYMHEKQLSSSQVRPQAEKISLVITDGNSQSWSTTLREARKAQADNITMFALGVGRENQVKDTELRNIAGADDRVTRVTSFDSLDTIREILAKKTCLRKEKPTTTPMPNIETCGEANPSDIEFMFSPADLGLDGTSWVTSFISNVINAEDMDVGFRYGANTGLCPDDQGFDLDTYGTIDEMRDHLSFYDKSKLPKLIHMGVFEESRGGRPEARDVAVIFVGGGKGARELESKVNTLVENGVMVFVANPAGYPINIGGAIPLSGRSSKQQSEIFIHALCSEE